MVHRGCGTADESPQCALRNPPAAWVHVSPGQFRVRLDQLERTNTFGLHPPSVSFFLLRLLNTTSCTGVPQFPRCHSQMPTAPTPYLVGT